MRIIYKSNKPECVVANHRPLTEAEGEELYYKRDFEFKLPYPCLNDFESNFAPTQINSSINSDEILSSNDIKLTPLDSNLTLKSQTNTNTNAKRTSRPTNSIITTSNNTKINSASKAKSAKYSKSQLIQQRAQQHAQLQFQQQQQQQQHQQQQLHHSQIYNNQYIDASSTSINHPNIYHSNESYQFNSNYSWGMIF